MNEVRVRVMYKLNEILGTDLANLSKCQELMKTLQDERSEIENMVINLYCLYITLILIIVTHLLVDTVE